MDARFELSIRHRHAVDVAKDLRQHTGIEISPISENRSPRQHAIEPRSRCCISQAPAARVIIAISSIEPFQLPGLKPTGQESWNSMS